MQFRKVQALRGPNVWANFPVLEAWLDLGLYKELASDEQPGFNDRLMAWLPSLIEHRCSVGERGGFFERLRRGTYPAHILEHVCLELQCLAGTEVGFGRVRASATDGLYKVVIEYEDERLARAALQTARRLVLAAIHAHPFDVAAEIEALRGVYREAGPTAETAALLRAARKRRIPARLLGDQGLIQLGHGARQRRLQGCRTDRTSTIAESVARDNHLTRTLLRSIGVPVPESETVDSALAAWEAAVDLGTPVSIRPRYGWERRPSWERLETNAQLTAAYEEAADGEAVIVERCPPGPLHRLLVVNGRVVAAVRAGEGSPAADVTAGVHPETAARACEAAAVVGLDVAGVEVVTADVTLPLEGNGAVLAVRARPPLEDFPGPPGGPHPAAEAILATLFPEGDNGRIPVVSITGTNGKTTTTRLIAHIFARTHSPVGLTCSEGIYVGGREIEQGDCSGPNSAGLVLQHPEVRAAVLETARGGILRAGLGFDRCLVAVVTNVGRGDHLGQNDIHTPDQVAKVKRTPVDVVLREGAAVLNAADPLVAAMAEHCPGDVIYFARDGEHPRIVAHRAGGKRAVFDRDGVLILAEGERETPLMGLDRIPMTHGGRVGFNVENALAAAAACWAAGIPTNEIQAGLRTFNSVIDLVPCRFNLLEYNGATVVLDYAHNISALASFLEVLEAFPHPTRSVVYAVPGDRSDDVIIEQAEMLGRAYDRVILYEDTELRGRPEGTLFALMRQGLAQGGRTREVVDVRGNLKAIEKALGLVGPGELLVIQPEFPTAGADFFRRLKGAGAREVSLEQACAGCPVPGGLWEAVRSEAEEKTHAYPALTPRQ